MKENKLLAEDEIDLRELFKTIWAKKVFIAIFTFVITVLAAIYAYTKTPIYEAKVLVEIGEYKTSKVSEDREGKNIYSSEFTKISVDDAATLEKKLTTLYVDMEKNIKDKTSEITSITLAKGLKNFLEIKSEAISNDEAKNQILKVLAFVQAEHEKILEDAKKQRELELKNIELQISDIKSKSVALIDKKLEIGSRTLENLKEQLKHVDENLKRIDTLNPLLAALKLMEKKDITTAISELTIKNFELEEKKDELLTISLYKFEENKKMVETILLPHNYKNTGIVGEIMTNDFPVKPKKSLIVAVAFVTAFILSIFLVFFIQFIQSMRKEA